MDDFYSVRQKLLRCNTSFSRTRFCKRCHILLITNTVSSPHYTDTGDD